MQAPSALLRRLFDAAVASAQPALCVPPHLPKTPPGGRLVVIGAGKASAAMARAVEDHWPGPLEGLVVTRYGHGVPCQRVEIVEAAHPVPDRAGVAAAERMLELVRRLGQEDVVLCLISGGGSSLLVSPAEGLTLADKQTVNSALLRSGATISEMNCLRRHLSSIKGGRLAAACHPARVINLLISDVPGDRLIDIASGPTVGDPTTCGDALEIVSRYGIALPEAARRLLESGAGESVKPDDPRLQTVETTLVAAPQLALEAAAEVAREAGYAADILVTPSRVRRVRSGQCWRGSRARLRPAGSPSSHPVSLLSGGETTVTLRGQGRGGRNVEFLLSLALALDGMPKVHALSADTDGVDGADEAAERLSGRRHLTEPALSA